MKRQKNTFPGVNIRLKKYLPTRTFLRNFPGQNARVRAAERPLTVVSNGSVASNTSKRSSGSSSNGESVSQLADKLIGEFVFQSSCLFHLTLSSLMDEPNFKMVVFIDQAF